MVRPKNGRVRIGKSSGGALVDDKGKGQVHDETEVVVAAARHQESGRVDSTV